MLILAIDSCGPSCAVGLWQQGRILAQTREPMERGQDARLIPMIVELLDQLNIPFAALDKIAVTRGPGSFTGARVGLAAARGIGLAAQKPVFGIDRFAIYHLLHAPAAQNVLVVIESKRTDLFCKYFPREGRAHDACLMTEESIKDFLAAHRDTIVVGDRTTPDDNIIAACAEIAASLEEGSDGYAAEPLYLRAPDVSFAAAKSR